MTQAQLRRLSADAEGFNPNLQSIRCETCWHLWRLVWIPDRMELHPAAPLGWIVEDRACVDCAARIQKWNRKHGDPKVTGRRKRVENTGGPGLVVTGINA